MTVFRAGGDLYDDLGGRLYLNEAPESAADPYGVVSVVSRVPDRYFDSKKFVDILIQFNLVSRDRSSINVLNYAEDLLLMFDDNPFPVVGYTHYDFLEDFSYPLRNEQDKNWEYVTQFKSLLWQ